MDRKIIQTLLSNNQNLLAVICDTNIVGEAAASISVEVLALLRIQSRAVTEEFVKRLIKKKVQKFGRVNVFLLKLSPYHS